MQLQIGIIGLGYVGLPLARIFAKKYQTIGFDINADRVHQLQHYVDSTNELTKTQLQEVIGKKPWGLEVTTTLSDLQGCNVYIITVPTPVDDQRKPDLRLLKKASSSVAHIVKPGDLIIYESTVYPGATEEVCVPILEKESGLIFNQDFFVGYSPERINPADKTHTVDKILKVTSGSTAATANQVDQLYKSVITAGTYLAPSIKVAEAAKVIENAQRDINIAFVNELAMIFNRLEIDTQEVLKAARTKWNFLNFTPGLVGGHCIGVDPYYLAQKAIEVGYHPEIILAGRKLNDSMGSYVSSEMVKLMLQHGKEVQNSKVLILGITFKENCPDVRNTKVIDIVADLKEYGVQVEVYDPLASKEQVSKELGIELIELNHQKPYDGVILAVAHREFVSLEIEKFKNKGAVIFDVKGVLGDRAHKRL